MSDEVDGVGLQTKVLVHLRRETQKPAPRTGTRSSWRPWASPKRSAPFLGRTFTHTHLLHGVSLGVKASPGGRVFKLPLRAVGEEAAAAVLFQQRHQGGLQGLHFRRRNLRALDAKNEESEGVQFSKTQNDEASPSAHRHASHFVNKFLLAEVSRLLVLVDEGPLNDLPLQIPSHFGLEQNLHQLAAGHHELGNQIHIPVAVVSVLGRWFHSCERGQKTGRHPNQMPLAYLRRRGALHQSPNPPDEPGLNFS